MKIKSSYMNGKDNKVDLTELSFHSDECGYYLTAKYRVEDEHSVSELNFPKIRLRINPNYVAIRQEGDMWLETAVDIGFGYARLEPDSNNVYFTATVLEEKVQEMTMDEIEKKLGYKVKIVNK